MHTPPLQKPRPLVPPPDEIMTPGRRSKRNSVANAVTVTGVTEALLVGEWGNVSGAKHGVLKVKELISIVKILRL